HLFVNGMYSTFFGFLGIYDFIFPSPELLEHLNLVSISKILVPLSLAPVVLIMVLKRKARAFPELTLLVLHAHASRRTPGTKNQIPLGPLRHLFSLFTLHSYHPVY